MTLATAPEIGPIAPRPVTRARTVASRLARRPLAVFGLFVIAVAVVAAALAPWIAPYAYDEQLFDGLTLEGAPLPPNSTFLLGTDLLGRDLLSRLLYGARTSLIIGIVAWVGAVLMRFTDLIAAFPALLLAIVLAAIFTPSLWIVALVIAMVNWVQLSRSVYTQTRSLAEREFIEAETALGAGRARILFRHMLPHLVPIMLVWGTLGISITVLLEATLSFLGIGVQPPIPSWGNIINENQTYFVNAPWLVFIPGAAILLLALAFNLVGDALRDILDPTLKGYY
jgi:peptide/nickel transport system permease protein